MPQVISCLILWHMTWLVISQVNGWIYGFRYASLSFIRIVLKMVFSFGLQFDTLLPSIVLAKQNNSNLCLSDDPYRHHFEHPKLSIFYTCIVHTPTSSGLPKSAVKIPTLMSQIIFKTLINLQLIALMSDDPHWLEQVGMVQHCTPMQILIDANFALNVLECLPLLFQIQV